MTARPDITTRTGAAGAGSALRPAILFAAVAALFVATGFTTSWNVTLTIVNMGLVSAIMALGVNMQWGYAGLFNVGVVCFVALGGLACVVIAHPPVEDAWTAGALQIAGALLLGAATVVAAVLVRAKMPPGRLRALALVVVVVGGCSDGSPSSPAARTR